MAATLHPEMGDPRERQACVQQVHRDRRLALHLRRLHQGDGSTRTPRT